MKKIIATCTAGILISPATLKRLKEFEVSIITAKEAMDRFGQTVELHLKNDNVHYIELKSILENIQEERSTLPSSKQKHPPRSFMNCGKGGKRKKW